MTVSHDCELKKTVTIKPKKTATIEIKSKEKSFSLSNKGKRNFSSASINIVYDKKKLEYSFEPKTVNNTRKNVTKFSCLGTYFINFQKRNLYRFLMEGAGWLPPLKK